MDPILVTRWTVIVVYGLLAIWGLCLLVRSKDKVFAFQTLTVVVSGIAWLTFYSFIMAGYFLDKPVWLTLVSRLMHLTTFLVFFGYLNDRRLELKRHKELAKSVEKAITGSVESGLQ